MSKSPSTDPLFQVTTDCYSVRRSFLVGNMRKKTTNKVEDAELSPKSSAGSSPESEMSYVVLETRRIRLILVIGLGAMILLQFLQLILTSTSEVGLLKAYEMTVRNMRSFETHHRFLCFCAT